MKKKPPAFQFYVKDWLSGTKNLTFAEKGIYIDLLAWSWDNGPLPAKTHAIALILGVPLRDFVKLWREVSRKFSRKIKGNRTVLINPRLERVRRERAGFVKKQRQNGKLGGRPRKAVGSQDANPTPNPKKALQSAVCSLQDQDLDQDHRAVARPSHAQLCLIAKDAYDAIGHFVPFSELSDEVKTRAARAGLPYDSESVRKALDAVAVQVPA